MKLGFISILIITLFATVLAANNPQLKRRINQKTEDIQDALFDTEASRSDLNRVLELVQRAEKILVNTGGGTDPQCIKFAYDKYYANNSSSRARTRATEACKKIADLNIAKFLWEKHYANTNSSDAMDRAAEDSSYQLSGKLLILKFAWEKYYANTNSSRAARRAAKGSKSVNRNSLQCLKSSWEAHYGSTNSAGAMDLAFDDCKY